MKSLLSTQRDCFVVLVCLALVPGCGKKLLPMAPVSGKVTVDGKPLTACQVVLVPDIGIPSVENRKGDTTPGLSTGTIDSNGEYTIATAGTDGAPLGRYKVTVMPSMVPSGDTKKGPRGSFHPKVF
jgi:hypothetical protein